MKGALKEVGFDIFENRYRINYLILALAVLIGLGSIYYTNLIVDQLKERERNQVTLYANTLEYITNDDQSERLNLITQEIIVTNTRIPVILTDADRKPINFRNIKVDSSNLGNVHQVLNDELQDMSETYDPIVIALREPSGEIYAYNYIYYENSFLLTQLQYYPYVQLSVIAIFVLLAYLAFSYSKAAEQNQVWVGLAKETAHQLGTPLSSLMAWIEYFKADPQLADKEITQELNKDIKKLEMITNRFSSIGSVPVLHRENICEVIKNSISYLQTRISTKVKIHLYEEEENIQASINKPLFDWVIENICKNAVDAMSGAGIIDISINKSQDGKVAIDIADNGKGIPKNLINRVFRPGFTTKKRGWGLGLTLVKRIVENYHRGRIFVKSSEIDQGTTFRIVLND
ncbi:MAG: sensor histidine kinase [Cyclobacteriaceae bacterium]